MNPNTTLGEVKARCAELTAKYGDDCCNHCEYSELGCCDPPDTWNLDGHTASDTEVMCDDGRMTVRKLIAYLSLCNPDYPVCFEDNNIEYVCEYRDITQPEQSYVNLI